MQIVFNNEPLENSAQSLWGFSGYLKEYKLLFDTGSNGRILLKNMQKLGVDVLEIEYIFISHSHWDHIGGIDSIIELNPNVTLFVPSSLSKHLIKDLKTLVKEVVVVGKKPQHLFDSLYSTGILGTDMPEQSLIVDGEKPFIISGCGHFGVKNIVEVAQEIIKKQIYKVEGGFHLLYSDEAKIKQTKEKLLEFGVKEFAPTHCSGQKAIEIFKALNNQQ